MLLRNAVLIAGFLITALTAVVAVAQSPPTQSDSSRQCTVCHLQWIEAFEQPEAQLLIPPPSKPAEAQSQTCLGCHDGSVLDSRQRVWAQHGHKTGIYPPETMTVPEELPLDDGKIVCRTCHTAHSGAGPGDLASIGFLRVPGQTGQLCRMCHVEKTVGRELGTHPIGGMPWPIPDELIQAGAKAQPGQRQVHCQVCHTAHGSKREHLLVIGVNDNQLCLTCHEKLRPRMWRAAREGIHPDSPVLTSPDQIKAIETMGTRIGSQDRLICLSCHRLHHGKSGRFMLAETLEGSNFCIQCHPDQQQLLASDHDLRNSAPHSRNRLGMTPDQSGPCGSCHMFHNLAIRPDPTKQDPLGICTSCHSQAGPAASIIDLKHIHPLNVPVPTMSTDAPLPLFTVDPTQATEPVITCLTCHDPHDNSRPYFLRDKPDNLCRSCHADVMDALAGAAHDPQTDTDKWPVPVDKDAGCLTCHNIHGSGPAQKLWPLPPAALQAPADAVCLACHKGLEWADPHQWSDKAVMHPRWAVQSPQIHLPLVSQTPNAPTDQIGCMTCHDPHLGQGSKNMLRYSQTSQPTELCLQCHEETATIEHSMHSSQAMGQEDTDATVCSQCHAIHASNLTSYQVLWAGKLDPAGLSLSEQRCLGCHGVHGTAKQPPYMLQHPEMSVEALNLAAKDRAIDQLPPILAGERITCITCHLSHGKDTPSTADAPPAQLAAAKPMLRSKVPQRICSTCHGFDAIRLFLYFHRPEKRQ